MTDKDPLDEVLGKITKRFGEDAIMRLGDNPWPKVEIIPTGSLTLDLALGVGGLPKGRIVEIYGPDASGKTTLCQHIVAEAQKLGNAVAYIDMEHALDLYYAERCGVDVKNLLVSQPDSGEQALEIVEELVRSKFVSVVIVDSVAALVPRAEIDGDMGDAVMGMQARLMSQALRKLASPVKQTNSIVVFTNQIRHKIGVFFGSPETTSGGLALKFYASVRLDIRRKGAIKDGTGIIGNHTRVQVVKNKVAPPFRTAEFDIIYGQGISRIGEIFDLGVKLSVLTKRGSYFSYRDINLGQGRANAMNTLSSAEYLPEIEQAISEKSMDDLPIAVPNTDDDEDSPF